MINSRILELAGLFEDLNMMWEKGFSKIPKDEFLLLVKLDPTSTETRPGKYFKDLIKLYKSGKFETINTMGLSEIMNKSEQLSSQGDKSILNNVSWLFNIYADGKLRIEDLYKASQYLEAYH